MAEYLGHLQWKGIRKDIIRTKLLWVIASEALSDHSPLFTVSQSPCSENPCENDGSCVALYDLDDFHCECPPLYKGKTCEKSKETCAHTLCNY